MSTERSAPNYQGMYECAMKQIEALKTENEKLMCNISKADSEMQHLRIALDKQKEATAKEKEKVGSYKEALIQSFNLIKECISHYGKSSNNRNNMPYCNRSYPHICSCRKRKAKTCRKRKM